MDYMLTTQVIGSIWDVQLIKLNIGLAFNKLFSCYMK